MSTIKELLDGVEVEWKSLGEVGEVRMCKRILKEQTSSNGEIPFYKIGTFGKEPDAYISHLVPTLLSGNAYKNSIILKSLFELQTLVCIPP